MRYAPSLFTLTFISFALFLNGCTTPGSPGSPHGAHDPNGTPPAAGESFPDHYPVAEIAAEGFSCPMCAVNVNKQLDRVPGVLKTELDLGRGVVIVTMDPNQPLPSEDALRKAVVDAGFTVRSVTMPQVEVSP